MAGVKFSTEVGIFLFTTTLRLASVRWALGLPVRVEQPDDGADYSRSSIVTVNSVWSHSSLLHTYRCCVELDNGLIKHKVDN
jgi:hypothetical protein